MNIKVEQPKEEKLIQLGVRSWPVWEKGKSVFPWTYDEREICYFLQGEVIVIPENGEPVKIEKGDLVTFPKGMSCTWDIIKDVKKHYQFG